VHEYDENSSLDLSFSVSAGNFSEALRLCQKPGLSENPLVKALLSYTLASMRRHEEAMKTAKLVLSTHGADESIIR
jgi:hypothetical protein